MDLQSKVQVAVKHPCVLGEGPVSDSANEKILWVDITECAIHNHHVSQNLHEVFHVDEMVGAIALREAGGLIAALQHGFAFVDPAKKSIEHIYDPEPRLQNRF